MKKHRKTADKLRELTEQQAEYVRARAEGLSPSASARRCGYAVRTCYALERKAHVRAAIAQAALAGARDAQGNLCRDWLLERLLAASVHRTPESQMKALQSLSRMYLQQVRDNRANDESSDGPDLLERMLAAKNSESTHPPMSEKSSEGGHLGPALPPIRGNISNASPGQDPAQNIKNSAPTPEPLRADERWETCSQHGRFVAHAKYLRWSKIPAWSPCPLCVEQTRRNELWLSKCAVPFAPQ